MQSYDSTSYQAQQQPVASTSTASSTSNDSLPSFELPSLPQIKAWFDSLPKPPSMGPGAPRTPLIFCCALAAVNSLTVTAWVPH